MEKTFGVIGGDSRQRALAQLLLRDGQQVLTWGVEEGLGIANTDVERVLSAGILLLPLPLLSGAELNAPHARQKLSLTRLLDCLEPKQLLFAGGIPDRVHEAAQSRGLALQDLLDREELAVGNAAVTAEGALQLAMEQLPVTLQGCRTLVLGFGRIGKLLAHRLQALGAAVTVAARKSSDLSWARAYGYEALPITRLDPALGRFRLLFNTAPARLLEGERLRLLSGDCLCIDLASAPGGIDREAARQLGLQTLWARGLPGKTAPETAAAVIRDTLYRILEEREENL